LVGKVRAQTIRNPAQQLLSLSICAVRADLEQDIAETLLKETRMKQSILTIFLMYCAQSSASDFNEMFGTWKIVSGTCSSGAPVQRKYQKSIKMMVNEIALTYMDREDFIDSALTHKNRWKARGETISDDSLDRVRSARNSSKRIDDKRQYLVGQRCGTFQAVASSRSQTIEMFGVLQTRGKRCPDGIDLLGKLHEFVAIAEATRGNVEYRENYSDGHGFCAEGDPFILRMRRID
jgi:hypothetical protein